VGCLVNHHCTESVFCEIKMPTKTHIKDKTTLHIKDVNNIASSVSRSTPMSHPYMHLVGVAGGPSAHNIVTSRCPYCAFGIHCKFRGMRSLKLCHLCQIMSFMSNHVIISNHAIQFKSCNSCQIMYFGQIMSFISNHVIHVK
jgi:hypothetical protein